MKTAVDIIEELAEHRSTQDEESYSYSRQAQNEAIVRQKKFWSPLSNIIEEVNKKYPRLVLTNVAFRSGAYPHFTYRHNNNTYFMYFYPEKGVSLQYRKADSYRKRMLASADTVEELIPSLISKLADVVSGSI